MLDIYDKYIFFAVAYSYISCHFTCVSSLIYSNIELKNKKHIVWNMHESFTFYIQRRMSNFKLKYAKNCNRLFERLFVGTND